MTVTNGLNLKSTMESLWLFDATPFLGSMSQYAHAPETYLSYLLSRKDAEHISAMTPRAKFRCPVDVEVYTSEELLVGRVVDNKVDTTITPGVYIYIEGDEKTVYFLYEGEYTFKLTGTGTGTMEYSVEMVDLSTDQVESTKAIFKKVELTADKKMMSKVQVSDGNVTGIDTPDIKLFITDDNDIPIKEVLPDESSTEVYISRTVTFNANGGTVNPATMTTGTNGKLPNLPNPTRNGYRFRGWYTAANGGMQITNGTIFTSDTTVYARWIRSSNSSESGSDGSDYSINSNGNVTGDNKDNDQNNIGAVETAKTNSFNNISAENKSPNTGDTFSVIGLFIVGMLAILLCIYIITQHRHNFS